MGQKDITQKTLESHNDVFADIINGIVFGGNDVVNGEGKRKNLKARTKQGQKPKLATKD